MAGYVTTNPPRLLIPALGGGPQVWNFHSSEGNTAAFATKYFSNGVALGMRWADLVIVTETSGVTSSSAAFSIGSVSSLSSTGSAALFAAGISLISTST